MEIEGILNLGVIILAFISFVFIYKLYELFKSRSIYILGIAVLYLAAMRISSIFIKDFPDKEFAFIFWILFNIGIMQLYTGLKKFFGVPRYVSKTQWTGEERRKEKKDGLQ